MRSLLVIAVLAGCGGGGKPAPAKVTTPKADPPKAAAKPACIRQPEEAASITHATGDEGHVEFCVGTAVDQCFVLDLASGKLDVIKEPPQAQTAALDASSHVETTNPELKVCTGGACKTLTPQVWPGAAPLHAATNGSVAVVMLGDAEAGKGYVDVYDVAKGKKLATFRYAHGDYRCGEVAMLGETIYVGANVCSAPSGRAALYSKKGGKIAAVGGRDFGTYGNTFTQLDATTWAFLEENGNKLAVQDVVKGKVTKTISVDELFRGAGNSAKEAMGNPGESAVVRIGAGRVAVIGGAPVNGSVAIVDLASGEVKVLRAPFCT